MRGVVLFFLVSFAGCGNSAPPPPTPPDLTLEVVPTVAPQKPYELKGDVLGEMTLEEVQRKYGVSGSSIGVSKVSMPDSYTLGGVPPNKTTFYFLDGVLYRIECSFPGERINDLANGLMAKYGKPSGDLRWDNGTSFISISCLARVLKGGEVQPACDLTAEHVGLAHRAYERIREDEMKAKMKAGEKAAKDL